jgi:hypothetical protein
MSLKETIIIKNGEIIRSSKLSKKKIPIKMKKKDIEPIEIPEEINIKTIEIIPEETKQPIKIIPEETKQPVKIIPEETKQPIKIIPEETKIKTIEIPEETKQPIKIIAKEIDIKTETTNPEEIISEETIKKKDVQQNIEEPNEICRICYDLESKEQLYTPCKCSGTIEYVHQSCLEKWIKISKNEVCPQCKYEYKFEKKYKYHFYKYLDNKYASKTLAVLIILIAIFISGLIIHMATLLLLPHRATPLQINIKYMLNSAKHFVILFMASIGIAYYFKALNITDIYNEYMNATSGMYIGSGGSEVSAFIYFFFQSKIKTQLNKLITSKNTLLNIKK